MSDNKLPDKDYLFLSAMLRSRETKMLSREELEQCLDADGFDAAAKALMEHGYDDLSALNAAGVDSALAKRREEVFAEIGRLIPESAPLDIFRLKYDYHNIKVLIKAEATGTDGAYLLSRCGRVAPETLATACANDDLRSVPEDMAAAVRNGRSILARTANPQLADFALDKDYCAALVKLSKAVSGNYLSQYVTLQIDSANLRTVVRVLRMGKDIDFLRLALIPGGSVGIERICQASASSEGIAAVFSPGPLEKAAALGASAASGGSLTVFELACDNSMVSLISDAGLIGFGPGVVIAYLSKFESELTAVRMILSGKLSGIAPDVIRERLRDVCA